MTPEEYLTKHLDVVNEALAVVRNRMEDRAAEFTLAATVADAPEVFERTSEAFQKLADMASQATSDLNMMTTWDKDYKKRVLRK